MSNPTSERKSVMGAYDRIEAHEELCAERYGNIHTAIQRLEAAVSGTKRTIDKSVWLALSTAVSIALWSGAQLYKAATDHTPPASQPAAISEAP